MSSQPHNYFLKDKRGGHKSKLAKTSSPLNTEKTVLNIQASHHFGNDAMPVFGITNNRLQIFGLSPLLQVL